MPTVELYLKEYENHARIEIIFALKLVDGVDNTDSWVPNCIGEFIKYPWNMGKWFGEGHTITMPRRDPEALYLSFSHLFLTANPPHGFIHEKQIDSPIQSGLVSEGGQKIHFLYAIPISEEEVHYIRTEGAKSFLSLMESKKLGWFHDSERESLF